MAKKKRFLSFFRPRVGFVVVDRGFEKGEEVVMVIRGKFEDELTSFAYAKGIADTLMQAEDEWSFVPTAEELSRVES